MPKKRGEKEKKEKKEKGEKRRRTNEEPNHSFTMFIDRNLSCSHLSRQQCRESVV
jgi:hypothetical protein